MLHLLLLPLRLTLYSLILLLPLLSFWLVSSQSVLLGGPAWLPWLAGGVAFGLPLFWELESQVRRWLAEDGSEADETKPAEAHQRPRLRLNLADRVMLNTLILNGMVLTALLGLYPQESFTALSTRGDWPLASSKQAWAETGRLHLLRLANGLEAFYSNVQSNPSLALAQAAEAARSLPLAEFRAVSAAGGQAKTVQKAAPAWPMTPELHPVIATLPAAAETDFRSVARYIAQHEPDPYGRVKAIYDYIASRVAYDAPALKQGRYPRQDAETVFKTRKAVCAGYSRLFMAMSGELGLLAVYVTGDARDINGTVPPGAGHAWNAVKIGAHWHLLDVTWGAGSVENFSFQRRYNPVYLLTPPEVFGQDHFPDQANWQLRKTPLSRQAFERQPALQAGFYARGYRLKSQLAMPIVVKDRLELALSNPQRQYLLAHLKPDSGKPNSPCRITGTTDLQISCPAPSFGGYQLELFSNTRSYGAFESIGQIQVRSK